MSRRAGLLALAALLALPGTATGQAPRPPRDEPPSLRVRGDGNELVALRRAPVPYATIEQLSGEIARGYSPLERPGPWVWLLDVALAREHPLTLQLRAEQAGWPVDSVTIDPARQP